MASSVRALLLGSLAILYMPAAAQAGMPSVTLTDLARLRVQTISFFLVGFLLSSWFVQLLWNYLRRDFTVLPRLSYCKALGVVILWGLLFILVLTMISGARELMTPGAWEKQGLTYRLAQDTAPAPQLPREPERRESLDRLRLALWEYAQEHSGHFPDKVPSTGIAEELWQAPDPSRPRYLYVGSLTTDQGAYPLVYEPGAFGDARLVLLTNGTIQIMEVEEILAALPPEER